MSALRDALAEGQRQGQNWRIRSYATFQCPFTEVAARSGDSTIDAGCSAMKEEAVRGIRSLEPDIVFITNTSEPRADLSTLELARSTRTLVEIFRPSGKQVVFLSAPPTDVNIKECYSGVSKPSRCVSAVTPQWLSVARVEQGMAFAVQGQWIDSRPLFCVREACPSFVGRTPTKLDKVHMTPEYTSKISDTLRETPKEEKVLP